MMQQKIVIKLKLRCDNCRSKAMKIATVADGVITVAWEGDGTDAATVTRRLRKNLGYADLQKIVIKVQVRCDKCRSKAMKIAAVEDGEIFSVAWEGGDKDKVVVIGDGVDAATLTRNLRKKLFFADLLSVEEVKEKKDVKKEGKKDPEPTPQSSIVRGLTNIGSDPGMSEGPLRGSSKDLSDVVVGDKMGFGKKKGHDGVQIDQSEEGKLGCAQASHEGSVSGSEKGGVVQVFVKCGVKKGMSSLLSEMSIGGKWCHSSVRH
ncbi:hypothetical protein LWI28_005143 [Acer negundo]|uniref:Uncharacterized protein n=1 Tax=Acer negundo TaxID=4023 RepID=A0AAD5NVU7_ACENE|nr:hypothetical protein LWI28_005143 [Acer negundo]